MAQQIIGVGAAPNDGTGDPLRTGGTKINANFTELYTDVASLNTAKIPAGGAQGQILAKSSNADYADAWIHPLLPSMGRISGRIYAPFYRTGTPAAAGTSHALGVIKYSPILISRTTTFDRVYVRVGSGHLAAGNHLFGIYNSDPVTGVPTTLRQTINAVALAVATTINTTYTITPDANITLEPGLYWFAVVGTAIAFWVSATVEVNHMLYFGTTNVAAIWAATSMCTGYSQVGTVLPATATPVYFDTAVIQPGFRAL